MAIHPILQATLDLQQVPCQDQRSWSASLLSGTVNLLKTLEISLSRFGWLACMINVIVAYIGQPRVWSRLMIASINAGKFAGDSCGSRSASCSGALTKTFSSKDDPQTTSSSAKACLISSAALSGRLFRRRPKRSRVVTFQGEFGLR